MAHLRAAVAAFPGGDAVTVRSDARGAEGGLDLSDPGAVRVKALVAEHGCDPEEDM